MLQPSQIETVSLRYGAEIAEVSSFLRSTGVPVETPAALDDVVQRLASNRAFHRDLGSHTWMLLYSGATVPETLAVLAVAALGPRFAATADEDSTHDLLRFVMESRSQLAGKSADRPAEGAPARTPEARSAAAEPPVAEPPPSREERRAAVFAGQPPLPIDAPPLVPAVPIAAAEAPAPSARPVAVHQPGTLRAITPAIAIAEPPADDVALPGRVEEELATTPRSKRGMLLLIAVCLLLVVATAGWWYLRRPSTNPDGASPSARVVDGAASSAAEPEPRVVVAPAPESEASPTPESARTSAANRESRWASRAPGTRYSQPLTRTGDLPAPTESSAPLTQPRTESASPAPITRVAPDGAGRSSAPVLPSSVAPAKAASGPVSNSVLSNRLGSPVVNQADAVDDRVAGARGYPRLLRRKPLDANGTLVAKTTPINIPGTRTGAIPSGTVHSTSLGISAGNLVYAPDPAYPADAAMQHISGQVKLEAMVDRQGNVASARVISGPPMLRDAAVSAVQQWRYKPYTAGGKPQTFTATAVMDFQLQ